jgi:hypothetical protein
MTVETGQLRQDIQDRTARTGQLERTGWPEHDSKNKLVQTGHRGWDNYGRQDSHVMTSGIGPRGPDSRDRSI